MLCFLKPLIITVRKRSLGQGNVFTPVCHSVHGGGGSSQHAMGRGVCIPTCNGGGVHTPLGRHPLGRNSPWAETPPGQAHPQADTPWADPISRRPLKQAVRILLECTLVLNYFQNLLHFVIRHHVFVATCNVSHKIHRILTSINLSSTAVISPSFVISICNDTEQQWWYLKAHCYQPMSNL